MNKNITLDELGKIQDAIITGFVIVEMDSESCLEEKMLHTYELRKTQLAKMQKALDLIADIQNRVD